MNKFLKETIEWFGYAIGTLILMGVVLMALTFGTIYLLEFIASLPWWITFPIGYLTAVVGFIWFLGHLSDR